MLKFMYITAFAAEDPVLKKTFILLMIILMLAGIFACTKSPVQQVNEPQQPQDDITVAALVPVIEEDYWKTDIQGMQEQADALNIDLKVYSGQSNLEFQAKQIENLISQDVDAIILAAVDVYSIMDSVEKCNKAGIPVIYNSRALTNTENAYFTYGVGYDVDGLAYMGAEWLARYAINKGIKLDVLELYGASTDSHTLYCKQGFSRGYNKYPQVFENVIGVEGEWNAETIYQNTYNALKERPEINCIILHSDAYMPSVQFVLTGLGRYKKNGQDGHVILAAMGGEAPTIDALKEGYADVLMATPIYDTAKLSVNYAYEIVKGKEVTGTEHILSGFIVDRKNFDTEAYNAFGYLGKK